MVGQSVGQSVDGAARNAATDGDVWSRNADVQIPEPCLRICFIGGEQKLRSVPFGANDATVTEGPNTNGFGGWRRQRWRRRTAKPPPKGKSLAMLVQEKGQGRIRRTARSEALGAQRLALLTSSLPAPSRGLLLVGAREMSSRKADGCTVRDNGQFDQTDHASKDAGSRYLARARSLPSREVLDTAGPSRRPNSAASLPACLPVHGRSVPFFSSTPPWAA